jgi:hypothetical protein
MSKIEVDTIAPQSGTTVTLGEAGDTVNIPSGVTLTNSGTATGFGISWQSSIVTGTTLSAVAGNGYWIDTTSNACTVTLPASASVGDIIEFADYARTWQTNNVTINQNSLNYQGNTSPNPTLSTEGQHLKIVYSGATQGWIPTNDDPVALGTPQTYEAEYLVVAGGGSGGAGDGAGGGAGGYLTNYGGTAISLSPGEVYTATVGAGGSGVNGPFSGGSKQRGNSGADSVLSGTGISTVTAIGGGGGGSSIPAPGSTGFDGGSGGGAGAGGIAGSGTAPQGFDGGSNNGGGGGASEAGTTGTTPGDRGGGDGLQNAITGSSVYYAGGGGGAPGPGPGGLGGGTDGATTSPNDSASSPANTGGGSGGVNDYASGNGGSGVVILRVATADYSGTTTGSPTVDTDGTDTIIKFTGDGTYTA